MDIKQIIETCKESKKIWCDITERGDMPPYLIIEKDGIQVASIFAPQIDKMLALKAAHMCRVAIGINGIALCCDSHMASMKAGDEKNWKPGEMQRMCDEEGACEAGLISDCLSIVTLDRKDKLCLASIPYSYHGKGTKFSWAEDKNYIMNEDGENRIEGNIPYALRKIMEETPLAETDNGKLLSNAMKLSPDQQYYHCIRATFTALSMEKFFIIDCLGAQRPFEEFAADLAELRKENEQVVG
jgi:hypothetical protein